MTKQQSGMLKGIGILMMLYVHLFHNVDNISTEHFWLYYGSTPLVQKISRLCAPVSVFLMISGYGFMYKYSKGTLRFKDNIKKIPQICIPYCIITLVMVMLLSWKNCDNSFGDGLTIVKNFTGFDPTYNVNAWFLLPYILLLLSSPYICRFVNETNTVLIILIGLSCHAAASAYIDHAPEELREIHIITFFFWCVQLIFEFFLGCIIYLKSGNRIFELLDSKWKIAFALAILCLIKLNLPGLWNPLFILCFIPLFCKIPCSKFISAPLTFFGKYSMYMWFIHGYLYSQLINVYDLNWPILIYISLIVCSLALSIAFDKLSSAIFMVIKIKK